MSFQEDPNTIRWRLNLKSQVDQVYQMLSTDAGRASFWGESAIERDGCIHFVFPNRIRWEAEILKTNPPHHYEVRYFDNSADAFALEEDGQGGHRFDFDGHRCTA